MKGKDGLRGASKSGPSQTVCLTSQIEWEPLNYSFLSYLKKKKSLLCAAPMQTSGAS